MKVRHTGAMRRGVWLLVLCSIAAALSAASARADGTGTTTTTGGTTTTSTPSYAPLRPSYLPGGCLGAGAVAIAVPGRPTVAYGSPASNLGPSGQPASGAVVGFASSSASGSSCETARVTLASVSLFHGLVTATSVEATDGKGSVAGLTIEGTPVSLGAGQTYPVGSWGQVTLGATVGRLTAPLVLQLIQSHGSLPGGTTIALAFAAAAKPVPKPKPKPKPHSSDAPPPSTTPSTPSGSQNHAHPSTTARTKKAHGHGKKHKPVPQPLTTTPPLGFRPSHYVFPVDGGASYSDTYGGVRNDIYDGWHHGDDLFAPLGTPVVAVANGNLSLVGWNRLGGWRLWLTDGDGNSFYYAHLAGYSRWILTHPRVRAGEVVGFLGRTGDAFTTSPHLHFEIHPQQYLDLGYDGAVDPTAYLKKWAIVHVPQNEMPNPAKLKAPVGTPAEEAGVVWHELLVARHLLGAHLSAASRRSSPGAMVDAVGGSPLRIGAIVAGMGVRPAAAHVAGAPRSYVPWIGAGLLAGLLALSLGAFTFRRRRRTNAAETPAG
jgi:murein DD-endopeptidase MepM/ murein hydrolase activator NlpD